MNKKTERRLNELTAEIVQLRLRVALLERQATGCCSHTVQVGPAEYKVPTITVPSDWGSTCGSEYGRS